MAEWFRHSGDAVNLTLYVQPGAKCNEISGLYGTTLKIRLAAPPVDGRANKALQKFIAKLFAVPLCQVALKQGAQSRHKIVVVSGSKVAPEILLEQHMVTK